MNRRNPPLPLTALLVLASGMSGCHRTETLATVEGPPHAELVQSWVQARNAGDPPAAKERWHRKVALVVQGPGGFTRQLSYENPADSAPKGKWKLEESPGNWVAYRGPNTGKSWGMFWLRVAPAHPTSGSGEGAPCRAAADELVRGPLPTPDVAHQLFECNPQATLALVGDDPQLTSRVLMAAQSERMETPSAKRLADGGASTWAGPGMESTTLGEDPVWIIHDAWREAVDQLPTEARTAALTELARCFADCGGDVQKAEPLLVRAATSVRWTPAQMGTVAGRLPALLTRENAMPVSTRLLQVLTELDPEKAAQVSCAALTTLWDPSSHADHPLASKDWAEWVTPALVAVASAGHPCAAVNKALRQLSCTEPSPCTAESPCSILSAEVDAERARGHATREPNRIWFRPTLSASRALVAAAQVGDPKADWRCASQPKRGITKRPARRR